jgi:hypothetical protein
MWRNLFLLLAILWLNGVKINLGHQELRLAHLLIVLKVIEIELVSSSGFVADGQDFWELGWRLKLIWWLIILMWTFAWGFEHMDHLGELFDLLIFFMELELQIWFILWDISQSIFIFLEGLSEYFITADLLDELLFLDVKMDLEVVDVIFSFFKLLAVGVFQIVLLHLCGLRSIWILYEPCFDLLKFSEWLGSGKWIGFILASCLAASWSASIFSLLKVIAGIFVCSVSIAILLCALL